MDRVTKRNQRNQINQAGDRDPLDHRILQENNEMEKVLQEKVEVLESRLAKMQKKERSLQSRLTKVRREVEKKTTAHKKIEKNYNKLWNRFEEALTFLADAEWQEMKVLENNAKLKHSNSVLMEQRKALHCSLEQMKSLFYEQHVIGGELMKNTLQNENKALRNHVRVLQTSLSMLEEQIKTRETGEEELTEQKQSQTDYYTLWIKYEEAMTSQTEAEAREKKASEVVAELEHNNSILLGQREMLKKSLKHLRDLFTEHRKMRIQLMKSTLQNENKALKKQVGVLQTKVRNLEAHLELRRRGEEELMDLISEETAMNVTASNV